MRTHCPIIIIADVAVFLLIEMNFIYFLLFYKLYMKLLKSMQIRRKVRISFWNILKYKKIVVKSKNYMETLKKEKLLEESNMGGCLRKGSRNQGVRKEIMKLAKYCHRDETLFQGFFFLSLFIHTHHVVSHIYDLATPLGFFSTRKRFNLQIRPRNGARPDSYVYTLIHTFTHLKSWMMNYK